MICITDTKLEVGPLDTKNKPFSVPLGSNNRVW